MGNALLIARQSTLALLQQRTVLLLAGLFVVLVILAAYLGWSATTTVNEIYQQAVVYLQANNAGAIPDNPVHQNSPLSLLRNMTIYVSLIGSLAAIIIGNQLISVDKKSGVLPLLGSRLGAGVDLFLGKMAALLLLIGLIIAVTAVISTLTLLLLPSTTLELTQWKHLALFVGSSYVYLVFFGTVAIASSSLASRESVALLIPVTLWLTLTFVFPALTHNVHPTAAINPISSLVSVPESVFFQNLNHLLAPLSIAENYKTSSAYFLEYLPQQGKIPSGAIGCLLLSTCISTGLALFATAKINFTRSNFNG